MRFYPKELYIDLGPEVINHYQALSGYWPDDDGLPAASIASCVLTIRFGPTTRYPYTTKRLRGIARLPWGDDSETAWAKADIEARIELNNILAKHGLRREDVI